MRRSLRSFLVFLIGNMFAAAPALAQTCSPGPLMAVNNGSDVCNPATFRVNVGAGSSGASGLLQASNGSGGFVSVPTLNGDATLNTSTGVVTVTKTNGVSFAPSATTDTTNAANISSGALPIGRVPTGSTSSSATVPLNNDGRFNNSFIYFPIGAPAVATTTANPAADMLFSGPLTYSIPASTTPVVHCGTNPASTLSIVFTKNGATLCTISVNTSCVASGCSLSATSFVSGDYSAVSTGADASATGIGVSIPITKSN